MLKFHFHPAEITDLRNSSMAQAFGIMTNVKEQFEQHKHYLDSTLKLHHQANSLQDREHKADVISIHPSEEFNGLNSFTLPFLTTLHI